MIDLFFLAKESWSDYQNNSRHLKEGYPLKRGDDQAHLDAAIDWLEESIINGQGGSAGHYSAYHGKWTNPFPETTGYIIPTLLAYNKIIPKDGRVEICTSLADWLIKVQLASGACMQGLYSSENPNTTPVIFNTGQNIFGYLESHKETGNEAYLDAAKLSAEFLMESVDENGVWNKGLLRGLKHTINTRTAWSLLLLNKVVPSNEYVEIAHANLSWTCDQQTENGWFKHGSSREGGLPNTHFLAYTCRGLLEAYKISGIAKHKEAAQRTATKMLDLFRERGMLFAFWDNKWNNQKRQGRSGGKEFICVTGCAQIASVWLILFEETGDQKYLDAATDILDHVKALQRIDDPRKNINGGIKGSFPIYGGYASLAYPNWAAKFFADALMHKMKLEKH